MIKSLDLTRKCEHKKMCTLKGAQIYVQPLRAARDLEQPQAAQKSFLPNGKKIQKIANFSSVCREC